MTSSSWSSSTTTRPGGMASSRTRIRAAGVCCGSRYRCSRRSAASGRSSRHKSVNRFGKFTGCAPTWLRLTIPSTSSSPRSSGSRPPSSALSSRQTIAVLPTPPRPITVMICSSAARRKSPVSSDSTCRSWKYPGAATGASFTNFARAGAAAGRSGCRCTSIPALIRSWVRRAAPSGSATSRSWSAIRLRRSWISCSTRGRYAGSARGSSRSASASWFRNSCSNHVGLPIVAR